MHLSYDDALAIIRTLPCQATQRRVSLSEAHGFFLAEDLKAPVPSPTFDNAAMDGFALVHAEARSAAALTVIATLHAGDAHTPTPQRTNSCVRIMTGSPVPAWCDTVVPVEQSVMVTPNTVRFTSLSERGAHIRRQGEDLSEGARLLRQGQRLGPEQIMVAAAFGINALPVRQLPRLGLFSSGDELREPGEKLAAGQIYNSSSYFLRAAARALNMPASSVATLPDETNAASVIIQKFLQDTPTQGGQLLITTGAVSRGEKDFIPRLALDLGFKPLLHRVAIRPGKPVFLAQRENGTLWLGLPGNPISTNVGWHFFLRPLLAQCFGIPMPQAIHLPLAATYRKPEGLTCFFRASWQDGHLVLPAAQGSAHYQASLDSQGFAILPAEAQELAAGTMLPFYPHEGWVHL